MLIFKENADIKCTRYELQKPCRITSEMNFLFNGITFDHIDITAIDSLLPIYLYDFPNKLQRKAPIVKLNFKVYRCEICSKSILRTPAVRHHCCSVVFFVLWTSYVRWVQWCKTGSLWQIRLNKRTNLCRRLWL